MTKINGKTIAQKILNNLSQRVKKLREKGITPHLVVILVGNNPSWKSYVTQKELRAKEIGAKVTSNNQRVTSNNQQILNLIDKYNNDISIHGIIVQRPLPAHLDKDAVSRAVSPQKDIDGFHPQSKHNMPLANAVLKILKEVISIDKLRSKKIVVIGKGETGGQPIIITLKRIGIKSEVIDSKTQNPQLITRNADIIISAVGKPNIVTTDMIKKGVILISVGLYKGPDGKLHGDYNEQQIVDKASFYTPTPGGVGPVNVACLLENLVKAAES